MKRIVKYISILSIMLCVFGFMTGVYADNEQGEVLPVAVEEQLADISDRLAEVEKLSKDELIEHYLRNEDKITAHADFWMGTMGVFVTVMSIAVVIFGAVFPYIRQKKSKKELQILNNEISGLRGYIDDAKNEMQAYTHFAMALNEDDVDKQIKLYTKAIKFNAHYVNAYINRGGSYYGLGEKNKAMADYSKALEFDATNANAYYNRANIYHDFGDKDKALADYGNAIKFDPNASDAYNNRGLLYYELGKYNEALLDFDKAIELNPNYVSAFNNRGVVHEEMDKHDEALLDFSKAIELNPNVTSAYNNRGTIYVDLGKYNEALLDFSRAIEIKPDYAKAYNNRALLHEKMGNTELYKQDMEMYEKLKEKNDNPDKPTPEE